MPKEVLPEYPTVLTVQIFGGSTSTLGPQRDGSNRDGSNRVFIDVYSPSHLGLSRFDSQGWQLARHQELALEYKPGSIAGFMINKKKPVCRGVHLSL